MVWKVSFLTSRPRSGFIVESVRKTERNCWMSISRDIIETAIAAGIYALRLLQIKRCGRFDQRAVLALDCCPNIILFVHPLKIKAKSSYFLSR